MQFKDARVGAHVAPPERAFQFQNKEWSVLPSLISSQFTILVSEGLQGLTFLSRATRNYRSTRGLMISRTEQQSGRTIFILNPVMS